MNFASIVSQNESAAKGRCRNRLYFHVVSGFDLAPLQHLQPGGPGVFPTRRYEVTPYEGALFGERFPGMKPRMKPWAKSFSPFGAKAPWAV
jgi:hypothetical protein